MANGYDEHSLAASEAREAASTSGLPPMAVRDARYTRSGVGWPTEAREATSTSEPNSGAQSPPAIMYPPECVGGVAGRRRGQVNERALPWEKVEEATTRPSRPREALNPSGLRENLLALPCELDARTALAVLAQFVDGETLQSVQDSIVDRFGPLEEAPDLERRDGGSDDDDGDDDEGGRRTRRDRRGADDDDGDDDDDGGRRGRPPFLSEAPLNADKRNDLPSSDFALPGRRYPIDTPERARSALARVKQFGSPQEIDRVRAAVRRKYPDMEVE